MEEQLDEIVALESIFGDDFSYMNDSGKVLGTLSIQCCSDVIKLPMKSNELYLTIQHLPPVTLRFQMPENYPHSSALKLAVECCFLNQGQRRWLKLKLLEIWKDSRSVSLFAYADYIQNEMLAEMGLLQENVLVLSVGDNKYSDLVDVISSYDAQKAKKQFERESFACGICFENKKGVECVQLKTCKHVYCVKCLLEYYQLMILEGNIQSVVCPDSSCRNLKQDNRISDAQLLEIVGLELFTRYQALVVKRSLENRPDVTYCPRPDCQSAVIKDANEEKLCICPKCKFPFCFYCHRSWHGYATFCRVSNMVQVVDDYLTGSDVVKQRILKQYGEKNINKMVLEVTSERETLEWIESNTTQCPTCGCAVEKSEGCNHIRCFSCNGHFCYLCGAYLDPDNPYRHFNDPNAKCHNRLFNLQDIDGDFDIFPEDLHLE